MFQRVLFSHSYTHNAWGHIETATHDGETLTYSYDPIGRVTSQTYPGNQVVGYAWDTANNLETLTWPDGFAVDYTWDANNRISKARIGQVRTRTLSDPSFRWVAPGPGTEAYRANGLNQYTSIDSVQVQHNANGNLKSDHLGRTFTYDAENVLRTALLNYLKQ